MSKINKFRVFFFVLVGIFLYWLYFECTCNKKHIDTIAFSIIIHSSALAISLSYFKVLKIPIVTVLASLNILGYAIAPANVDFKLFQLGEFNAGVFDEINIGYIMFYFSHFIFLKVQIDRHKSIFNIKNYQTIENGHINAHLNILQNYSLMFYILSKILTLPISGLNEFVELITIGSLMIGLLTGVNSWFKNILTVTLLIFISVQILVAGLIYPLIFFGLFIFALIFLYGIASLISKLVISFGVIFVIFFSFLFNPVKMEYRKLDLTGKSIYDKLFVIQDLISSNGQNETEDLDDDKTFFWRLTYPMSAISMVKEKTPSKVPFWNGESYYNLFYKFIPRFVWQDKPSEDMGQLFGHRYDVLNRWNFTTSINTPIIAEAYINFGVFGFYSMFILMGYILARSFISSNIKNKSDQNSFQSLISGLNVAIVLTFLLQWESNFSMVFGKVIILFIVNQLIEFLAFRKQDSNDKLLHLNLMK